MILNWLHRFCSDCRRITQNSSGRHARPRPFQILAAEILEIRTLLSVSVGTNTNISKMTGNQHESSISIDPTNSMRMFAAANREASGNFVAYSQDGGSNWVGRILGTAADRLPPGGGDVQTAWDSYGNLFLTYLNASNFEVELVVSTDGGATFTALAPLSLPFADQPSIAVGANSVWVSYTDSSSHLVAVGAPVTGLGSVGSFRSYTVPDSFKGDFGDIAVGPGGQVLVTYQYALANPAGPDSIVVNENPTGINGTFGAAMTVTSTQVGGADFSVPAQSNNLGIDAEANLAWDRSGGLHQGRVYLVYTNAPSPASSATDIYVQYSDDNGATWSGPVRVTDDPGSNSKFLPSISVDPVTGAVGVAWYDARNDLGTGGLGDTNGIANDDAQLWAAISTDGGVSFQANVQVSAGTSNAAASEPAPQPYRNLGYGDFNKSDFYDGRFFRIWADNSNFTSDNPGGTLRTMDVYTAPVSVTFEAPTYTAPASQTGLEGSAQSFDLGAFSDPDGGPWTVDVNWGDGSADTIFTVSTTGALGTQSHNFAEEGVQSVSVTVTDFVKHQAASGTFQVDVTDPPVTPSGIILSAVRGAPLYGVVVATFTDAAGAEPNPSDPVGTHYTADINWGDGTNSTGVVTFNSSNNQFSVAGDHTYSANDTFSISVTIHHETAPPAATTSTAVVVPVGIGVGPEGAGTLLVGGTLSSDSILVSAGKAGNVIVSIDGLSLGTFAKGTFSSIAIYGQAGDDVMGVDAKISVAAYLFGGLGNDQLTGGSGANLLAGGAGNDTLTGGKGRNVLIGGDGADTLLGAGGDDLLIAGYTNFEEPTTAASNQALHNLLSTWGLGTGKYNDRVAAVAPMLAGRVFDDGQLDILYGGSGMDLFYVGTNDLIQDKSKAEIVV